MRVTVRVEGADEIRARLDELGQQAAGALQEAAEAGAEVLREAANRRAPGPHIETEVVRVTRTRATVDIGPDEDHWYYRFFERGAQPHEISGALSWIEDGEDVFTRRVHHPGMAAAPFLRPAIDENRERAERAVRDALRRRLRL